MRAFIKGCQISSNSNFTTADYSEYEIQNGIWEFYNEYTLIEVQNAINTLIITYQEVNKSQLDRELKRIKSKYNNMV